MAVQAYLILLYFTLLSFVNGGFLFFVYKFKVCGNPVLNEAVSAIYSAVTHFTSLCHILAILTVFQNLSLLLNLFW